MKLPQRDYKMKLVLDAAFTFESSDDYSAVATCKVLYGIVEIELFFVSDVASQNLEFSMTCGEINVPLSVETFVGTSILTIPWNNSFVYLRENTQSIPRLLWQTDQSCTMSQKMRLACLTVEKLNPTYKYQFFNAEQRREFMIKHASVDTLKAYDSLIPGAYQATLWRYCVLYKFGGVYMDVKVIGVTPLDAAIHANETSLLMRNTKQYIHNTIIACVPEENWLAEVIACVTQNVKNRAYGNNPFDIVGMAVIAQIEKRHPKMVTGRMKLHSITAVSIGDVVVARTTPRGHYTHVPQAYVQAWHKREVFKTCTDPIKTKRIIILGGDGFYGFPLALRASAQGNTVLVVDNFIRRKLDEQREAPPLCVLPTAHKRFETWEKTTGKKIEFVDMDVCDSAALLKLIRTWKPHVVIHLAEQRSAPFSMRSAEHRKMTIQNNTQSTQSVLEALVACKDDIHLIHVGSLGVYGYGGVTDDNISSSIMTDKAGSVYHASKVMDHVLISFYARNYKLRCTDVQSGIIWGTQTTETRLHTDLRNRIDYDGDYGTVVNRFVLAACAGWSLPVYGNGEQRRGIVHISDAVDALMILAACLPPYFTGP